MRKLKLVEVHPFNGMVYSLALPDDQLDAHEQNVADTGAFSHVQEILHTLCPAGSLVLDIGANVGSVAIPLALQGVRVIAYDVLAENIEAIELGARSNGVADLVTARHAGAWHETCALPIVQFNTLALVKAEGINYEVTHSTPAVRLADEIPISEPVTAIKIDIEGGELNALRGAEPILKAHRPHLLFEVFPSGLDRYGSSAAELFAYLTDLGYDIYRIARPALSPGYSPPAEQAVVDYLATTLPPDELAARCGYEIRRMTDREIIDQIKLQAAFLDWHRQYVLAIADQLPKTVREDPEIAALLSQWTAQYTDRAEINRLRRATLGPSAA